MSQHSTINEYCGVTEMPRLQHTSLSPGIRRHARLVQSTITALYVQNNGYMIVFAYR